MAIWYNVWPFGAVFGHCSSLFMEPTYLGIGSLLLSVCKKYLHNHKGVFTRTMKTLSRDVAGRDTDTIVFVERRSTIERYSQPPPKFGNDCQAPSARKRIHSDCARASATIASTRQRKHFFTF
jgi:hypothetical protein